MSSIIDSLKVKVQYFMPKILLSRAVGKIASSELGTITTFLIKTFIKYYNVNMGEAKVKDPARYKTFNEFFTRVLKNGARQVDDDIKSITHPADGAISQFGEIYKDAILQAKGHYYSLETLVGGNSKDAKPFENGCFVTTYLSPKDYHRVHMPLTGKLEKMIFVPGDLFSVNPLTANNIDNLFARNERVICFFNNEEIGRFAVVMVGATIVASISTVFAGVVAPKPIRKIYSYDYTKDNIILKKGDELGAFLLGSTTICLFEKNKIKFDDNLTLKSSVKMGQVLARIK